MVKILPAMQETPVAVWRMLKTLPFSPGARLLSSRYSSVLARLWPGSHGSYAQPWLSSGKQADKPASSLLCCREFVRWKPIPQSRNYRKGRQKAEASDVCPACLLLPTPFSMLLPCPLQEAEENSC